MLLGAGLRAFGGYNLTEYGKLVRRLTIGIASTRLPTAVASGSELGEAGKELRILTAVFFSTCEFELALEAICANVDVAEALITAIVVLDDLPAKFEDLRLGRTQDCKVLISPNGSC